MDENLPTVELKTAYQWFCEECGESNFEMSQKAELTEESREEAYRDFHEMDEWEVLPEGWEQFELVMIPDIVECNRCKSKFQTKDERTDEESY